MSNFIKNGKTFRLMMSMEKLVNEGKIDKNEYLDFDVLDADGVRVGRYYDLVYSLMMDCPGKSYGEFKDIDTTINGITLIGTGYTLTYDKKIRVERK